MAPVPQTNTISHFTHPGHRLSPVNVAEEYRCDGCKTNGAGARFRCGPCDFDLHEYCATCPSTLSSFMHPHPLNLVQRKSQSTRRIERVCDVCGDGVEALFYRFPWQLMSLGYLFFILLNLHIRSNMTYINMIYTNSIHVIRQNTIITIPS